MKTSDFDFELPEHLIAQAPTAERAASRLLRLGSAIEDSRVSDLPEFLKAGDLLVFNDTRVIKARMIGRKPTGGRVEVMAERVLAERQLLAQIGSSKPLRAGGFIEFDGETASLEVVGRRDDGFYELRLQDDEGTVFELMERIGRLPLPPYIERLPERADDERYQTVFARNAGAVAAPTAGLHFDQALLEALSNRGIEQAMLTLHVGAGTFQPVRVENVAEHQMHSEWYDIPQSLVSAVERTRIRGGRVVCVGTTSLRALESAVSLDGTIRAGASETNIFITPGYEFRAVDLLFTNFHLPQSTLMMLVSAFGGHERLMGAYRHAVEQQYRFFSYGDAMLIEPDRAWCAVSEVP